MINSRHTQLASQGPFYNLLDNGAFTNYTGRHQFRTNSISALDNDTITVVDESYFGVGALVTNTVKQGIGSWVFAGAACALTIAPTDPEGNVIPSVDGGNVLKVAFQEDGVLTITQTIPDVKRLEGQPLSFAMTGMNFSGKTTISILVVEDGEVSTITSTSAASLGGFRRFGATHVFKDSLEEVSLVIELDGCQGESLGLSGIAAGLGVYSARMNYTSSLVDRVIPSGVTFMFEGEACPPGYEEVAKNQMALVSGVKAVVEMNGAPTTEIGDDFHDHAGSPFSTLGGASDTQVETTIPINPRDTSPVRGIPFANWPSFEPYAPYPGELPLEALGAAHTHQLSTKMSSLPPTFPMKFCKKL